MKASILETRLEKKIFEVFAPATPGLCLQVHLKGKKVCDLGVGEVFPYYDLASLTKIVFTVQAMILAFDQGLWNLNTAVYEVLPWFRYEKVRIVDLLTHRSGLPAHLPIYKDVDLQQTASKRWDYYRTTISQLSLQKEPVSVYSDVGFWVLGMVLEKLYNESLLSVWLKVKSELFPRCTLDFHPGNVPPVDKKYFAPTERCPWRGRIIHGEVHDENAWAMGGVAPHAGLFGSVDDVSWFGLYLRGQLLGISKTQIRQKTMQLFTSRALEPGEGDWALGFMMPTPGSSSCGDYFSSNSIGHTGFTGTSVWYDPSTDVLITLLSNRLYLGRDNHNFKALRPKIHNWVIEGLKKI